MTDYITYLTLRDGAALIGAAHRRVKAATREAADTIALAAFPGWTVHTTRVATAADENITTRIEQHVFDGGADVFDRMQVARA